MKPTKTHERSDREGAEKGWLRTLSLTRESGNRRGAGWRRSGDRGWRETVISGQEEMARFMARFESKVTGTGEKVRGHLVHGQEEKRQCMCLKKCKCGEESE